MVTFLSMYMICFDCVSQDSHSLCHQHVRTLAFHICLQPSDLQVSSVNHSSDHESASHNSLPFLSSLLWILLFMFLLSFLFFPEFSHCDLA